MSESDIGKNRTEINPVSQGEGSQTKLREGRARDEIMKSAHRTSEIIEGSKGKSSEEILEKIRKGEEGLRVQYGSHPEQQSHPSWIKRKFREYSGHDPLPRAKRSGDVTKQIIDDAAKIYDILQKGKATALGTDQMEDIMLYIQLANAKYDKTFRYRGNDGPPDTRETGEMNRELQSYRDVAASLRQWVEHLENRGEVPKVMPPEARRKHQIESLNMEVETLNNNFRMRGDLLTYDLEELKNTYGDDPVKKLRELQSKVEETKKAANSDSTESVEEFGRSVQELRRFYDDYIRESGRLPILRKDRNRISTVKERKGAITSLQKRETTALSTYDFVIGTALEDECKGSDIGRNLQKHRYDVKTIAKDIEKLKQDRKFDPEDATSYLEYEQLVDKLELATMYYNNSIADAKRYAGVQSESSSEDP